MRVHGIPNCDTVKKARAWLDAHGVAYAWVDFRKTPPTPAELSRWAKGVGWETLLNRRGTTWRGLDEATRTAVVDEASAVALMSRTPTLVKRPVIDTGREIVVGFAESDYARRFGG